MEGKYCNKLNSKGIQTVAAFIIIVVSGSILILYDLREKIAKLLNYIFKRLPSNFESYSKRDTRKAILYNLLS